MKGLEKVVYPYYTGCILQGHEYETILYVIE